MILTAIYIIAVLPILLLSEFLAKGPPTLALLAGVAFFLIFLGFVDVSVEITMMAISYVLSLAFLELAFPIKNCDQPSEFKNKTILYAMGYIFFGLLIVEVAVTIFQSGGIIEALLRNRLEAYLSGGITSGGVTQTLILLLFPFGYLFVGYYLQMENSSNIVRYFPFSILMIWLIFNANTRLGLLVPLVAIAFLYYQRKVYGSRIGLCFVAFLAVVFLVPLINFGTLLRLGELASFRDADLLSISFLKTEVLYSRWLSDMIDSVSSSQSYRAGLDWTYTQIINFIPRVVWSAKPITSVSANLSGIVYGANIGAGDPVTAFTVLGEAFWQFWYFGPVILAGITFLLFRLVFRYCRVVPGGFFVYSILLAKYLTVVRAETPITQLILYLVIMAGIARIMMRGGRASHGLSNHSG